MHLTKSLPVGAVLALTTFASSQGTVNILGSGCPGPNVCASANANQVNRKQNHNQNIFALGVPASSTLQVVTGFQLHTQATGTSPLTINTQLYGADTTGKPTGTPIKTGTMVIGTTPGWYTTTFATPLILTANTKIFISYTSVSGQMHFPFANSTLGTKVSHFWHSPTSTSWNGTAPNGFVTQAWCWKLLCGSGNAPVIGNTGVPTINTKLTVDLSNAPANANSIFALGISDKSWGTIPLPLDLTPVNAAGCNIYVSLDFVFLVKASAAGTYNFGLTVPNDNTLKGFTFFTQYACSDASANGLGISFTGYAKLVIN